MSAKTFTDWFAFHGGEELAAQYSISREAASKIWEAIEANNKCNWEEALQSMLKQPLPTKKVYNKNDFLPAIS